MRLRFGVMASPLLASAMFLFTGCESSTNEEGLDKGKAADAGEGKTYKSYGDYALEKADQLKKDQEAAKSKAGTPKKP